jgi:lysyl-tRNA synthetase class 2
LRPLPEKFHGLTDQEQKYRQRYLDLIMNHDSRELFVARSQITQNIRQYLVDQDYLEVETPMMHPIPGGATARPFVTHHHTLDMPLYLRIAPELYLKRLIVGGLERVFEINRNFRNEGISTRHNPEFTMIELYEAYANYHRMMQITEEVLQKCAHAIHGKLKFDYQGQEVDLSSFKRFTLSQAIHHHHPEYSLEKLLDKNYLYNILKQTGKSPSQNLSIGQLQLLVFEETTEELLWQPTFIIDYPVEVSPLARSSDNNPLITERFELFIVGRELANGYSELNDPDDQADRFRTQASLKEAGDHEAMHFDEDYIKALEYGMPPTGGLGIGIDRLVMLLCDAPSIRDVILFPQLRMQSII